VIYELAVHIVIPLNKLGIHTYIHAICSEFYRFNIFDWTITCMWYDSWDSEHFPKMKISFKHKKQNKKDNSVECCVLASFHYIFPTQPYRLPYWFHNDWVYKEVDQLVDWFFGQYNFYSARSTCMGIWKTYNSVERHKGLWIPLFYRILVIF
jgi:hypothetical protein